MQAIVSSTCINGEGSARDEYAAIIEVGWLSGRGGDLGRRDVVGDMAKEGLFAWSSARSGDVVWCDGGGGVES